MHTRPYANGVETSSSSSIVTHARPLSRNGQKRDQSAGRPTGLARVGFSTVRIDCYDYYFTREDRM